MKAAKEKDEEIMMKRRYVACAVFAAVSAIMLAGTDVRADFESGWQAYQRGNFGDALKEWRPLAESGDPRAQFNLGAMYDEGKGVAADPVEAVKWWQRSAEQGLVLAQQNLASSLIAGDGVPQDFEAAVARKR